MYRTAVEPLGIDDEVKKLQKLTPRVIMDNARQEVSGSRFASSAVAVWLSLI
jgi:hypothetical protein